MRYLVAAVGLAITLALTPHATHADTPDIEELIARVDRDKLREYVDAIDGPRSVQAQPDALDAAATYVQDTLVGFGYPVDLEQVGPFNGRSFPNITATREGTTCPERIFIIGGHYDSVPTTPGADDNASGTAGMLELARVLKDVDLPATVWFTGFSAEELGLVGSRQMADRLHAQGAQVVGMYSLEMIGYTTPDARWLAIVGNTASVRLTDAYHRTNNRYFPGLESAVLNVEGVGEDLPDVRRSDHASFWDRGYQAVIVTDTANLRNPNYHQPTDSIDTLDFDFMTTVTKIMLATTIDYLTYDGDHDGEPDVCSGPLAATPTPTPRITPVAPTAGTALPTATATPPPSLPSTGGGTRDGLVPRAAVVAAAATGLALAASAGALRRRSS